MFNTMRIRTKLAIALSIPLIAMVILSSVAISTARNKADSARANDAEIAEEIELATATSGPTGLFRSVSDERSSTAIDLVGFAKQMNATPVADTRVGSDKAIADFKALIASKPQSVQDKYKSAIAAVDKIPALRAKFDASTLPKELSGDSQLFASQAFDDFTQLLAEVGSANAEATQAIDDPQLRNGSAWIQNLLNWTEAQTVATRIVGTAFQGGVPLKDQPENYALVAGASGQLVLIKQDMLSTGEQFYTDLTNTYFDSAATKPTQKFVDDAVLGKQVDITQIMQAGTLDAQTLQYDVLGQASTHVQERATALRAESQQEADDASNQANTLLFATIVVLLLAAGVTYVASRSITKPLHRLTEDAESMATSGLPETVQGILDTPMGDDVALPELSEIDKSGGYEIAEVASALNTVQASAADLAVEQAVLRRNIADSFVNLGRRNQNLLSRQLDSITDMERTETDPDELKKLFTLDHLATRMRRNAESLLLLAGLEPHRQWSAPVAIVDILRGALGEVEDYERVSIRKLDAATIKGTAAADITHLIAELLENALNFSPPGRDVEIVGRQMGEGYTLAIIDNGIGMDADELAQANIRLSGQESYTVAPSKYLGHYVVGRQAARLDVSVQLQDSPAGGVTATIELGSIVSTDETTQLQEEPEFTAEALVPERFQRDAETDEVEAEDEVEAVEAVEVEAAMHLEPGSSLELDWELDDDWDSEVEEEAPVTTAPATLAEALPSAPENVEAVAEMPVETTTSGYKKRVRGAHTPKTNVLKAHNDGGSSEGPASEGPADVRNALSGLQAGQERAKNEVTTKAAKAVIEPAPERTTSGYTKRVKGANTPNTNVLSARGDKPADESTTNGAEGVRNALSGLQSGQQRAKQETSKTDDQEEGR